MNKTLIGVLVGILSLFFLIGLIIHKSDQLIKHNPKGIKLSNSDFNCLVENIYHEAGNQPWIGKVAVAYVTINRMKDSRWPNTICEVVWQRVVACQFSWTCDIEKIKRRKINEKMWDESYDVVLELTRMYDPFLDPTRGSTHFHATYVKPDWRNKLNKVVIINDHIFYR